MKNTSTLEKKLTKYTAAAGSVLAASAAVNAQVVYTDVDPDFMHNGGTFNTGVDLNNDATIDFVMASIDTTITNSNGTFNIKTTLVAPYGTVGNEVAGSNPGGYNYALALNANDMIDNTLNWIQATNTMAYNVNSANPYNENWNGVTDKFLGLRFSVGGNQHYGWARLDVQADGDIWTLKDYAYNATAGQGLPAGSLTVGVAEDVENSTAVFAWENVLNVNIQAELTNGVVMITNMNGQVVAEERLIADNNQIDLNNLASGVYTATVQFDQGVVTKRIFVK